METLIEKAKRFATEKHKGQFRFDGVTPYINHPEDVARRVAETLDKDGMMESYVIAALCHDLIEDVSVTEDDLREAGFPEESILAIKILTKTPGEDYFEYLKKVKENPIARKVKICDMLSNLSDSPTKRQVKKYAEGLSFLLREII